MNALETAAETTLPIPVSVAGMSLLGISLEDWVLIGTACLIVFQLIVTAPKVWRILKSLVSKEVGIGSK